MGLEKQFRTKATDIFNFLLFLFSVSTHPLHPRKQKFEYFFISSCGIYKFLYEVFRLLFIKRSEMRCLIDCISIIILQVQDLTHLPFAERELMLIKIAVNADARRDVLDIATIFRAKPVDVSDHTVTLEVAIFSGNLLFPFTRFLCIQFVYTV